MDLIFLVLFFGGFGLVLGVTVASLCHRGRPLVLTAGIVWVVAVIWMLWHFNRCSGFANTCGENADFHVFWIAVDNGIGFSVGALTSHLVWRRVRDMREAPGA